MTLSSPSPQQSSRLTKAGALLLTSATLAASFAGGTAPAEAATPPPPANLAQAGTANLHLVPANVLERDLRARVATEGAAEGAYAAALRKVEARKAVKAATQTRLDAARRQVALLEDLLRQRGLSSAKKASLQASLGKAQRALRLHRNQWWIDRASLIEAEQERNAALPRLQEARGKITLAANTITAARARGLDPVADARLAQGYTILASSGVVSSPVYVEATAKILNAPLCTTDFTRYPNGLAPSSAMCSLTSAPWHKLRPNAARSFNAMSKAYERAWGKPICITDSYRTLQEQIDVKKRKPTLAAKPGTSKHGLALAVDLCGGVNTFGTPQHLWMRKWAPSFGFYHPTWARVNGSKPEPWHWEYVAAPLDSPLNP